MGQLRRSLENRYDDVISIRKLSIEGEFLKTYFPWFCATMYSTNLFDECATASLHCDKSPDRNDPPATAPSIEYTHYRSSSPSDRSATAIIREAFIMPFTYYS